MPHCLGAVGSATRVMQCYNAFGQWAVQLLECTASLLGGLRAVELLQCTAKLPLGSGEWTSAMHCINALGQWAVQLLQRATSLASGSGQCKS